MRALDLTAVKIKSLTGILALTSRTFFLQVVAFGATFILTIFLSPSVFGVFYVVSAVIAFLNYFSDIGLAAALVQKKDELTQEDLATTFTIQQLLVVTTVLFALIFSQPIGRFYGLDTSGVWLFRALAVSFLLSSLKTIPSVLLERNLDFHKLVIPQVLETVGFYGVAVVLAWSGMGIASFTWAVLVRAIVGIVSIYGISPWRIRIGLSLPVAKRLLRFGFPFQLNSFLALVKDDLLTVALGKILPFAQVGYIGWAKKWAEVPLRLIMDSVIRVTFPAFARLQHDRKVLGAALGKTVFGLSATVFPITVLLLFIIRPLVDVVPRYEKWEPAILSFSLFAVASAIASLSTPLTNALNAVGKIKTTLSLMILWTASTWFLTLPLVFLIGFNGVAVSLLAITSTLVLVVRLVRQVAPFSFWRNVRAALLGSLVQGGWYFMSASLGFMVLPLLIVNSLLGVILYGSIVWLLEKEKIKTILLWKK